MSKQLLQNEVVMNLILESLVGPKAKGSYQAMSMSWLDTTMTNTLYLPVQNASVVMPPVIVSIQETVDLSCMLRIMSYSNQTFSQTKRVPVVIIFSRSKISHDVKGNFQTSESFEFLHEYRKETWMQACYLAENDLMRSFCSDISSLPPLLSLSLFFSGCYDSFPNDSFTSDSTIKLLKEILHDGFKNSAYSEDVLREESVTVCQDTNELIEQSLSLLRSAPNLGKDEKVQVEKSLEAASVLLRRFADKYKNLTFSFQKQMLLNLPQENEYNKTNGNTEDKKKEDKQVNKKVSRNAKKSPQTKQNKKTKTLANKGSEKAEEITEDELEKAKEPKKARGSKKSKKGEEQVEKEEEHKEDHEEQEGQEVSTEREESEKSEQEELEKSEQEELEKSEQEELEKSEESEKSEEEPEKSEEELEKSEEELEKSEETTEEVPEKSKAAKQKVPKKPRMSKKAKEQEKKSLSEQEKSAEEAAKIVKEPTKQKEPRKTRRSNQKENLKKKEGSTEEDSAEETLSESEKSKMPQQGSSSVAQVLFPQEDLSETSPSEQEDDTTEQEKAVEQEESSEEESSKEKKSAPKKGKTVKQENIKEKKESKKKNGTRKQEIIKQESTSLNKPDESNEEEEESDKEKQGKRKPRKTPVIGHGKLFEKYQKEEKMMQYLEDYVENYKSKNPDKVRLPWERFYKKLEEHDYPITYANPSRLKLGFDSYLKRNGKL